MSETSKTILSTHACSEIDRWLTRYPADQKRSGVLQALTIVQEENGGWLTEELIEAVADYLEMPRIAVYEVVSFYTMYNVKPAGQHIINVCTNISCMLNGAEKIVDHLKKRLEIDINQTTADGKFTLREVECLAACAGAPMFQIGKKYYENLTLEKVDVILREMEPLCGK
ncbi:MAG: NADH dehydrogenase (Ubiquinone), 24 kDa subunit [uncultured bacterium]|nr:MAG: NADH dehydrogenase (Ubiquinone), 24 kDa subunit [uncultured bacterium]